MIEIRTPRLHLRPIRPTDLEDLARLYADAEVMRWITGRPRSNSQTALRLQHHMLDFENFGFGLFATLDKHNGRFLGRCGFEPRPTPTGLQGELAWMFVPPAWGRGLAMEVGRALIRFARQHTDCVRLFATAHHQNKKSIAVMRRIGLHYCATRNREVEYETWI